MLGLWSLVVAAALWVAAKPATAQVTVDAAVAEGIANNAALLAEKAEIDIGAARILTARLRPNPVASFSGDHLDLLGTGFDSNNGGGPGEIAVGMQFTWQRGGKRERRVEVAETARAAAEFRFANAVRQLTWELRNAFVDALLTRDMVALARENLGFLQKIVDVNEVRLKAGDIAEVELVRSRLAALQYETAVRQAEQKHRTTLVQLQRLMGRRRPDPGFSVSGSLDRPDASLLLDDVRKQALEQRPDLLALRRDLDRAAAEWKLQMANAKQDWTVEADYRRQQFNAKANAVTVTVGMPLPVFDRNQGEIQRALQEQRQAGLRLQALESQIAAEVEDAYSQFLTARSLLHTVQGAMLQQARDVRQITEFAYRCGDTSLLALLDAQRAFNETMQAYIEARAEYARSLYLLAAVSGKERLP